MLVVYDEMYREHLRGVSHVESPDRVAYVAQHLQSAGLFDERVGARDASDLELERVHTSGYVERVKRDVASRRGRGAGYLSTGDTAIDESSLAVARRAAGGALRAVELSLDRNGPVFALVRPPGHHAGIARGMGFCIFNNVALAARAYMAECGGRALVLDFDYHHGNGTQEASGTGLSYVSTHAYPQYPMTGRVEDNRFTGDGTILNIPLPPGGYPTEAFIAAWSFLIAEVAERLRPGILIVSAGYDYALGDPIGDLGVDGRRAASALAAAIGDAAERYCGGRAVYVLEGGYDLELLGACVEATIRGHGASTASGADPKSIPAAQRVILEDLTAWRP